MSDKNLLIVPGSLRANSSTQNIIRFILKNVPPDTTTVFDGTGRLPHFNDEETPPFIVNEWRRAVNESSAVLFVTPEYAYGIPGTLKNALDWLVGSGDISGKPTGLITAATGGEYAHADMRNTLRALNARTTESSRLLLPFIRSKMDSQGEFTDPGIAAAVNKLVVTLQKTITD